MDWLITLVTSLFTLYLIGTAWFLMNEYHTLLKLQNTKVSKFHEFSIFILVLYVMFSAVMMRESIFEYFGIITFGIEYS